MVVEEIRSTYIIDMESPSPQKNKNNKSITERGFFGCYLLNSVHQRAASLGGRTYIGFTVDPRRRLRQHNGIITQGAYKTRKWRPWDMVMVVHGFANQKTALQFEWTWQHAETSLDTREAILSMKELMKRRLSHVKKKTPKLGSVLGQILILFVILSTPPWKYYPLHIRCMSGGLWRVVSDAVIEVLEGKNLDVQSRLSPGFLLLPEHMSVSIGPLDDFVYEVLANPAEEIEESTVHDVKSVSPKKMKRKNMKIRCVVCCELAQRTWSECQGCACRTHVTCLAEHSLQMNKASPQKLPSMVSGTSVECITRQKACLPSHGLCPQCCKMSSWDDILATLKTAGWRKHSTSDAKETDVESATTPPVQQHKDDSAQILEARTPLESLILKTQSLSMDHQHLEEESLAFRMLRRLREEGTASPSMHSAGHVINKDVPPHDGKNEESDKENSDVVGSIINLCSSEDCTEVIDLVNESPQSVESKVDSQQYVK